MACPSSVTSFCLQEFTFVDSSVLNVQFISAKARTAKDHAELNRGSGLWWAGEPPGHSCRVSTVQRSERINWPCGFTWHLSAQQAGKGRAGAGGTDRAGPRNWGGAGQEQKYQGCVVTGVSYSWETCPQALKLLWSLNELFIKFPWSRTTEALTGPRGLR